MKKDGYWLGHPAIILFLFSLTILLIRIFFRGQILLLDESEQVMLAQELLPGYPGQPPLYTWLQYLFFKALGVNLFSLTLLKCSLFFFCLYFFHLICKIHCETLLLAWCATLSWTLIPAIGLDLIKDNTHSILALLTACLTWYWMIIPERFSKYIWYTLFGCILAAGLLAKFNYLLFLVVLLTSALSLKEFRKKFIHPYMIYSLLLALLLTCPYLWWLWKEPHIALSSIYKLHPNATSLRQGMGELTIVVLIFSLPAFVTLCFFFPKRQINLSEKIANRLLHRYHIILLPVLFLTVIIGDMHAFKTRWLIPLLFLFPVFYLSQVKYCPDLKTRILKFVSLSLLIEVIFLMILILSHHFEQSKNKQKPLQAIIELLKYDSSHHIDWIVSDSYWLLGNLTSTLAHKNVWLLTSINKYHLPQGQCLLIWKGKEIPFWVYAHDQMHASNVRLIEDTKRKTVIGGYTFMQIYESSDKPG
ncbi:Uncharacterised protein [Legionella lansingensis]|uniref:Glycosyltransferase RgtA/B/C/D-like domain-containing protein n=1 Tax=Legionella lansingensis TaxID=45067 RepID=A0A0W0VXV4_9GAMM|nr:glycosyltransferase family 39 protein [Legionella lansingensis]KTD24786.1 hypothetical protein Llan_0348 [Legionella lansingensis]SNV48955.1 Uncharacterised protein [Legionella lansingensis]